MYPKVAEIPYLSFQISASVNTSDLILDFYKESSLNYVIDYKKSLFYEDIEDHYRSNMAYCSILQNTLAKKS